MPDQGLHRALGALLRDFNTRGGYTLSLVCDQQGLPLAAHGTGVDAELLSAFTSLFDDVVQRAVRDLGFTAVDEVTLLEPGRGRFVIRPLAAHADDRMYLVVQMAPRATWRRNTGVLVGALRGVLAAHGRAEGAP